jgi:16S rRNA (adenine1518-N6/adenine1519-N6)-dimethyltransferase
MDVNVIHKIASACRTGSEDIVVEIGAGIGVLTSEVARRAAKVIAVELDARLVEVLHERFDANPVVQIHAGDVLKFDFSSISDKYNSKVKVIGNVPYNISSPVIFHLLESRAVIENFTMMLQKEVVERLVSPPGVKSYGVPSVLVQMYADVERLFDVSSSCFYPRPKVESCVMQGEFRERPLFDLADEEFFVKVVRTAFGKRRKTLLNNFRHSPLLGDMADYDIRQTLEQTGIDGKRRGETLSLEEFSRLSNHLFRSIGRSSGRNA